VAVTDGNRAAYRQLFSAVFSDFHLFEQLLDVDDGNLREQAGHCIERLGMTHKVKVEGNRFSTISLSTGQRKRLAMVSAYLDYPVTAPSNRSDAEYIEEFDEILRRAVVDRLNADVPVGFYLSVGLDSSLIGGIAQGVAPDRARHSFSIAFADQDIDERPFQRAFNEKIASNHHEILFDWKEAHTNSAESDLLSGVMVTRNIMRPNDGRG
jgi:hypothetical protein